MFEPRADESRAGAIDCDDYSLCVRCRHGAPKTFQEAMENAVAGTCTGCVMAEIHDAAIRKVGRRSGRIDPTDTALIELLAATPRKDRC